MVCEWACDDVCACDNEGFLPTFSFARFFCCVKFGVKIVKTVWYSIVGFMMAVCSSFVFHLYLSL